jgi:uncharacterized protein
MLDSKLENNLIISVNPTEDCNLSCKYCRVPKNIKTNIMSYKTLENLFENIATQDTKSIYVIWHGGEPTFVGQRFYEDVVEIEKDIKNIRNGIQTNGTLLTEKLIKLFKKNQFRIGISLDGPKRIHDSKRIFKDGSGSYEKVMHGIKLLNKLKADFATLTLLTNDNINFLKEIYSAVRKTSANGAKFEVFFPGGKGRKYRKEFFVRPEDYTKVMINLYNLWMYEDKRIKFRVDPLDKIIESFFTGHSRACDYAGACGNNFLSMSSNGDIYICGRFVGIKNFKIGNINHDSLEKALKNKLCEFVRKKRNEIKLKCINSGCKYVDICNGGCTYESYTFFNDFSHETLYCNSRKAIFDHIFKDLKSQGIL